MTTLSTKELERYRRHIVMREIGKEGQLQLKKAKILIVGAGGLGAPLGLYLTAAGVGRIGIVDFDTVEVTNLQRQVAFGTKDIGRTKITAAQERLGDLNPEVEIVTHQAKLSRDNALDIIRAYDIVADGSDNFPTRYLVNDACVMLEKPTVYGSVFRFEGQASVFGLKDGPCYRCLYPDPPARGSVPSCAEGGVLGVVPGIIGAIQANETIKLILGIGDNLSGRLLLFDALGMSFRELRLEKNSNCPMCGTHRTIHELIDYDEFCDVGGKEVQIDMAVPEIEPLDLKQKMDAGENIVVLDVREPHEYEICNIGGQLIPMGDIPARIQELDPDKDTVVMCRTGQRSATIVGFLQQSGFEKVWNLRGGIHGWADDVDPSIPKY